MIWARPAWILTLNTNKRDMYIYVYINIFSSSNDLFDVVVLS
jgi:hypothetical protein